MGSSSPMPGWLVPWTPSFLANSWSVENPTNSGGAVWGCGAVGAASCMSCLTRHILAVCPRSVRHALALMLGCCPVTMMIPGSREVPASEKVMIGQRMLMVFSSVLPSLMGPRRLNS